MTVINAPQLYTLLYLNKYKIYKYEFNIIICVNLIKELQLMNIIHI